MAELWFQVVTRTRAERDALTSYMHAHAFREEIVGHEKMLEAGALRDNPRRRQRTTTSG